MPMDLTPKEMLEHGDWMRRIGFERRKATPEERAARLVEFSDIMLRHKITIKDARCLIDNWEAYGPDFLWWYPKQTGGKNMPRLTRKKIAKKAAASKARVAAKSAPKSKKAKARAR